MANRVCEQPDNQVLGSGPVLCVGLGVDLLAKGLFFLTGCAVKVQSQGLPCFGFEIQ